MDSEKQQQFLGCYHETVETLFRHCFFRVHDRERAKELVQEAYCRLWAQLVDGKDMQNMRAFLYRIVHNLIVDYSRKKKMISLDELIEQGLSLKDHRIEQGADVFDTRRIYEFLRTLSVENQTLVIMRFVDDLGPSEIATALGMSENVVSVRLNRVIKKMRAYFLQT